MEKHRNADVTSARALGGGGGPSRSQPAFNGSSSAATEITIDSGCGDDVLANSTSSDVFEASQAHMLLQQSLASPERTAAARSALISGPLPIHPQSAAAATFVISPTSPTSPFSSAFSTSPAASNLPPPALRPNRVVQLAAATMPEVSSASSIASDYSQQEHSTVNQSQTLAAGGSVTASPASVLSASQPVKHIKRKNRHDSESDNRIVHSQRKTVYTAGRPPWFDWQDNRSNNGCGGLGGDKKPFVIGICGGSASGKTTVAKRIVEVLDVQWVSLVSMDSFYKILDEERHQQACRSEYNFDHPSAFDIDLLVETLTRLKMWKSVEVPIYNFTTHSREKNTRTIYGANVVILEGIMAFCDQALVDVMDLKIFVDTDSDIRLVRRLTRDILERGRDLEGVLKQYNTFVKPAYENYIEPTRCKADIVVPRGGENSAAIKLIAQHVHNQLVARGNIGLRSKLSQLGGANGKTAALPNTLYVLENTLQVKGMHTIIRNRDTSRDDFIFYSKRLMRLVVEYAVSLLPYRSVSVETPENLPYSGHRLDLERTCAVSILRAGETLEPALRAVMKDSQIGKILIQTNLQTGEPELHYHRLPPSVSSYHVLLLDATVSTGSAAIMAIRVLLDHDVKEENIILVSLLMAEVGAHNVAYCYPRVKIVTTAVDKQLDEHFHILPGLGNFGDRFFGTD